MLELKRRGVYDGETVVNTKQVRGHERAQSRLADNERQVLLSLIQLLRTFRAKKPNLSLTHLQAFLQIAYEEGRSVGELTNSLGVAKSVASRYILDLGPALRDGEPGLGLVEHRMS